MIRVNRVAGRVEMFNGKQNVFGQVCSYDVCSLYPYIMAIAKNWFPCGKLEHYTAGEEPDYSKLGFYRINLDQRKLKLNNLPYLVAKKDITGNNWDCGVIENCVVGNKMMELIKFYDLEYELIEYWQYTQKIEGYKLFGWILDFMKLKNHQDILSADKKPEYNAAL